MSSGQPVVGVSLATTNRRKDFEEWIGDGGLSPRAIERNSKGDYIFMQAASAWHVWKAAQAHYAKPTAPVVLPEPFGYFKPFVDGWMDCKETDEGARPLYEAPQPQAVPEGWKLVPERPTQNMCNAAKYGVDGRLSVFKWADAYKVMCNNAPPPPKLASEPQPQAVAPVVLPEPGINTANHASVRVIGYTEQQVRELLDNTKRSTNRDDESVGLREALVRAHDWMDSQADSQSKGGHETFDLMMLRAERNAIKSALDESPQPQADARDAERYRWLRDKWLGNEPEAINMERAKGQRGLDAAIDAAIAAAKENK